jgi:hypothetical protein
VAGDLLRARTVRGSDAGLVAGAPSRRFTRSTAAPSRSRRSERRRARPSRTASRWATRWR